MDDIKFPKTWNTADRNQSNNDQAGIWNNDNDMFHLRRINSTQDLPTNSRFEDLEKNSLKKIQNAHNQSNAQSRPQFRQSGPHTRARTATVPISSAEIPNAPFKHQKYTNRTFSNEREYRNYSGERDSRFVDANARKHSQSSHGGVETGYQTKSEWKKKNPIGIFVWGFQQDLSVKDLIDSFGSFGNVLNVGFNTKNGIKYAFIDYDTQKSIQDAFRAIPREVYFGTHLQVRFRYDKISMPSFDAPYQRAPIDKSPSLDEFSLKICDLPPSMNKAELELHLQPITPYTNLKVLTRAVDRKSYAYITFANKAEASSSAKYLKAHSFLKDKKPLDIEYPSHDSTQTDLDYKTIHLQNLPHNVNKPEIESVLSKISHMVRIKIFQRAAEKKSSVFVTMKTTYDAQRAAQYLKSTENLFNGMTESLDVEYPTQDISRGPPVFVSTNSVGLSKKARKLLAAENRIAYLRSAEKLTIPELNESLSIHGNFEIFVSKEEDPWTAFIVFETPQQCAEALAAKTMGCNLPRHKRVDFVIGNRSEKDILTYLASIGEFKNVSSANGICTIEFLTALGAAKAIVFSKQNKFFGEYINADYSPTIKEEGDTAASVASTDNTSGFGSLPRKPDVSSETLLGAFQRRGNSIEVGNNLMPRRTNSAAEFNSVGLIGNEFRGKDLLPWPEKKSIRQRTLSLNSIASDFTEHFPRENNYNACSAIETMRRLSAEKYSLFGDVEPWNLARLSVSNTNEQSYNLKGKSEIIEEQFLIGATVEVRSENEE